ncbi:hypothetical protein BDN72DRAFT_961199 [Pluteus cervinus]|uniref:Uncharacterized protein n=1 Tax=Pluteus cervinus TaxID=181527 RepID=A0ACD3ANC6_9AGAR|nr:hypothetical protein BDN72DRAFT_961199 [Pluteus cervinus]
MEVISRDGSGQFSGINRLPPEVLALVFSHLTQQLSSKAWTGVTLVCRYWRFAALGSGALWSNIKMDAPSVELWLNRSNSHLLSVQLHHPSRTSLPGLHTTLHELIRIRELHLSLTASLWRAASSLLEGAAPVLESFFLESCEDDSDGSDGWDGDIFSLPANLFAGVAPNLVSVELTDCLVDLKLPIFQRLTSLTLMGPAADVELELDAVIEALRAMPDLETLVLYLDWGWLEPGEGLATPAPNSIATLPRLSKVTIKVDFEGNMYILSRLRFTPTTTVMLKCFAFNVDVQSAVRHFISAYDNARGDTLIPVHRMELSEDNNPVFAHNWLLIQIHRKTEIRNFVLDIRLGHRKPNQSPDGYATELFLLPLARNDVTFVSALPLSYSMWRMLPLLLTNLRHLSLKKSASGSFLDYLNWFYSNPPLENLAHGDAGDDAYLDSLPLSLESLEIDGPDPKGYCLEGLIKAMKDRKSQLNYLKLRFRGDQRADSVEALRLLVKKFEVQFG